MLSIGEFSNICKVSTKTLRYYAEIGLLRPREINPENGYRYYSIEQLENDLANMEQGKAMMSYLEEIHVQLVEVPEMYLLSVRKMVQEYEFAEAYGMYFGQLFRKIQEKGLTMAAPPMVLFHSAEYRPCGMDTEFAIPVKECAAETRNFYPGLCLKTVLRGPYSNLPSVYAKQQKWAEEEGYVCSDALYEVYVTDPSQAAGERDLITEVYYPVKKRV